MILVVGGAGYIGSHMCKALREAGEPHLVLDNLEKGHREALGGSAFVQGDIRDPDSLDRLFTGHEIDVVMHFAAYIMVGESVQQPSEYWQNNFVGMLNLLDAMRRHGVGRLVFSSTAAVYGEPQYVPIDEDHPKAPSSPYGDSKLAVEMALKAFDRAYGVRSVSLRYFNASGADPDGVLGEDHDPESHLIPAAILAAMGKTPPMTLFGDDYDTPDGTCIRDYVHVMDLVDAHLLAVRRLRSGGASARYNLGNGQGFSVKEVIETVENVTGLAVPRTVGPRREGDPARLVASSERVRRELGWSPRYADLGTIVQHAWEWRRSHPDGYASTR